MKFCHTFWSKPLLENKFYYITDTLQYLLYHYACSLAYVKACGQKIVLYTDEFGKHLFDFLPYDEIIILDEPKIQNISFAAQYKFEALKRMDLCDVLIDGDIIIRNKKAYDVILDYKDDAIYTFYEPNSFTMHNERMFTLLDQLKGIKFKNDFVAPDLNSVAYPNTSFLKFNNQDFKDKYIEQYFHNIDIIKNISFFYWPDIILEQYFLQTLANKEGYSLRPIFPNYPSEQTEKMAIEMGFAHIGHLKFETLDAVKSWLMNCNPYLYNTTKKRTEELIKKYS